MLTGILIGVVGTVVVFGLILIVKEVMDNRWERERELARLREEVRYLSQRPRRRPLPRPMPWRKINNQTRR